MMTGKEIYQIYLGMKLHFTQKGYNYMKYGPRKVDESSMAKFYVISNAISRKFQTREAFEQRLIALFKHKVVWLNEVATPEAEKHELRHLADLNSFSYNLKCHLELMSEEYPNLIEAFQSKSPFEVPPVCRLLLNKQINLETYCALDNLLGFSKNINDLVWKNEKLKAEKYKAFFNPDLKRVAAVCRPFF